MTTASTHTAIQDILQSTLDRTDKLHALRQLERDLKARAVAAEEGMGRHDQLGDPGAVRAARRKLRDPELSDQRPPTKYS